jgi:hypothetical protein
MESTENGRAHEDFQLPLGAPGGMIGGEEEELDI